MVFKSIAVWRAQGQQTIPNPRVASPAGFRGTPVIGATPCASACSACAAVCPTAAIALEPVAIDLGRCILCGDCAPVCPSARLSFSSDYRLAATDRASLVVSNTRPDLDPVAVSAALHRRFGRSLKLRSVSAGGCNGCELEVNALTNVNFDIGRFGIDIVASPRHADGLVLTGPVSRNMSEALQLCWDAMPAPKLVIAVGACAISGGPYAGSPAIERGFLEQFAPTLYVPGCPPHPLTMVGGLLDLLGIRS